MQAEIEKLGTAEWSAASDLTPPPSTRLHRTGYHLDNSQQSHRFVAMGDASRTTNNKKKLRTMVKVGKRHSGSPECLTSCGSDFFFWSSSIRIQVTAFFGMAIGSTGGLSRRKLSRRYANSYASSDAIAITSNATWRLNRPV